MKVFLVVGTLFPFDRLVKEIDRWAGENREVNVVAQVGYGKYKVKHIEAFAMVSAKDFNRIFDESDLIITHAGMGIIIKSLVAEKPIVVLPRRLELKEHTTDHQMATARALDKKDYVYIAWDIDQLRDYLKDPKKIRSRQVIGEYASSSLLESLRDFIQKN